MMNKKGIFFTIEGGEGSGKSSVVAYLRRELGEERFLYTREPGGTYLGEDMRNLILAERKEQPIDSLTMLLAVNALRRHHIAHVIRPALNNGIHVICDRFDVSTYGYQVGAVKRDAVFLGHIFHYVHQSVCGITVPDFVIFLDVPSEDGIARVKKRAREKGETLSRFDNKSLSFHEDVRKSMLGYLRDFYPANHAEVDASQPFGSVASVVLAIVRSRTAQALSA